ncbi:hypothetical protein ACLOJK_028368 [Asimina triloba]
MQIIILDASSSDGLPTGSYSFDDPSSHVEVSTFVTFETPLAPDTSYFGDSSASTPSTSTSFAPSQAYQEEEYYQNVTHMAEVEIFQQEFMRLNNIVDRQRRAFTLIAQRYFNSKKKCMAYRYQVAELRSETTAQALQCQGRISELEEVNAHQAKEITHLTLIISDNSTEMDSLMQMLSYNQEEAWSRVRAHVARHRIHRGETSHD